MSFLSIKFYGAPIKSPVLNWNSKWQVLAISSGCFFGQDRLQSNDIGRIRIESNWTRILFKKMVTVVSFRHCCWLHSFWCWLMKTLSIFSFVSFFPFSVLPAPVVLELVTRNGVRPGAVKEKSSVAAAWRQHGRTGINPRGRSIRESLPTKTSSIYPQRKKKKIK